VNPTAVVPSVAPPALSIVEANTFAERPTRDSGVHYQRAVYKKPQPRRPIQAKQTDGPKQADFYALSYTGDPAETDAGGRIVRVEMPRSSLFALGINLPLENDDGPIKADLLIGRDGSTKGIRLVR